MRSPYDLHEGDAWQENDHVNEAAPVPAGRQMYLSFPVDDVDAVYAEPIERGATPIVKPRDVPGQQSRLAHFSSHDGHIIEIFAPMREATV